MYTIKTQRLGLRNWTEADIESMAAISSDPKVMEYFPSIQNKEMTANFVERMQKHQLKHGFCYFAVDLLANNEMIGFIGLCEQDYESKYTPHVDIGWRLSPKAWGRGLATEGAKACLEFAFDKMKLEEVYAVAPSINIPSQRVMEKIGMEKIEVFDHPKLLDDDRLKSCVLYRKKR